MRIQWMLAVVLTLIYTAPVCGQSLAEVAKQERERRAKSPARDESVVYTNADLEKFKHKGQVASNSPRDLPPRRREDSDKSPNARSWQRRMSRVEEKIRTLKLKTEDYDRQIRDSGGTQLDARSRTQVGARGRTRIRGRSRPYIGSRSRRPRAGGRADLEQKKAKAEKDLQRALDEKHRIEEEARRAGVLPGVLRGQ